MGLPASVRNAPLNQDIHTVKVYENVNGVAQKVSTPSAGVAKTTFGVDGKAYNSTKVSQGSILAGALGLTGVGATAYAVGSAISSYGLEAYYEKAPWLRPAFQNQYGLTGDAAKAKWKAINGDATSSQVGASDANPSGTVSPYSQPASTGLPPSTDVPPPQSNPYSGGENLISVLLKSVNQLSRLADVQSASYAQQVLDSQKDPSAAIKSVLDGYKTSVDDAIRGQFDTFGKQYTDQLKAVDDKLLANNSYIDDLNANFKDAYDKAYQAQLDAMLKLSQSSNQQNAVLTDVARILDSFAIDGLVVKKDEKDHQLQDAKIESLEYHSTPIEVKDMDGNTMVNVAPRELKNIESASTARKHTDQNNFEMHDDEIDSMFTMPDISQIFKYDNLTDRLGTTLSNMQNSN
jgi:vacuolar-type H+-ATPase subunit E/Vma4